MALSKEIIKQAVKEHFVDAFQGMVKQSSMLQGEMKSFAQFKRISTGCFHPIFNGIFQLEPQDITDQLIREQIQYFNEKKLPFVWHVNEDINPEAVGKLLSANGFKPVGKMHGVAIELDKINPLHLATSKASVKRVETKQDIIDWVNIMCTVFNYTFNEGHLFQQYFDEYSNFRGRFFIPLSRLF